MDVETSESPALARGAVRAWIACIATVALGSGAAPAVAATTIGQVAAAPMAICSGGPYDLVQEHVNSGPSYVVPTGVSSPVISSWSTNAATGGGQTLTFKVFRKVGAPATFQQVAHDGPRPLAGGTLNTFAVDIPVIPGDILGVNSGTDTACLFSAPGEGNWVLQGDLSDGQSGDFHAETDLVNISAVVKPSNVFTIGAAKKNKKKGTARLAVTVPGPGSLALSGKGVKAQQASATGPLAAKTVAATGAVTLLIKAKGEKKRTLNEKGKVKLNVAVTYTPTGGDPSTQSVKVKLKKKR
jgi:hypothetical protein